ncbi:MAG TPA: hypothetical protein VG188_02595 [Solirubrobacteraceae bacterium]|jgi:hypothetical protein|nr:hypothetical protein [Solirubrobacteraceae bacterium]
MPLGRWGMIVVAIVGSSAIAGGCAGSSEGRISRKALAAKADVICFHIKQGINAADADSDNGIKTSDRAELSVLYAAAEQRGSDQMEKLKPEASAEREWHKAIAKRRALIPYHHRITKYASRGEVAPLEATYKAYKLLQWQMELGFRHTRFPFKLCGDIG